MMRLRSRDEKDLVSILEENLIDSSPKKEILEKKSGSLDLNMLDSGLNEEITSSDLVMDGNVEVESVVEEDDGHVKVINVFGNNLMDEDGSEVDRETKKMKDEEDGESDGGVKVIMDKGFTMINNITPRKKYLVVKVQDVSCWWQPGYGNNHPTFEVVLMDEQGLVMMRLRSSDEKDSVSILEENLIDSSPKKEILGKKLGSLDLNMLDSGLNEEITSSALVMDGNVEVESVVEEDDDDVINVLGNNLMDEDGSDFDGETKKMKDEVDGESAGGVVVKKGNRGRKRKVVGSSEKVKVENDGVRVSGRVLRASVKMTKGEIGSCRKILDENGVEEVDERALLIGKEQKKQKRRGRPPKMNGETVKNNDHTTAEDTVKNTNTLKLKNCIGGRRMEQQLVRDQIVGMIMKAGWTIEYRPRQNKQYLDAVYVNREGKTHWSVTKAYFSLKMKIEKGLACNKEVSAFTSIPKKKLSVLLRFKGKM